MCAIDFTYQIWQAFSSVLTGVSLATSQQSGTIDSPIKDSSVLRGTDTEVICYPVYARGAVFTGVVQCAFVNLTVTVLSFVSRVTETVILVDSVLTGSVNTRR